MKLELYALDIFLKEIMERKINTIYYYYEEFDTEITFTARDGDLIISYVLKEVTVTFNKDEEIKKLEGDLPGIIFRKGIIE